jgi:CDP-diacylglycerol--glycerol-3-phosphate 3-phosphatidyltransferase
MVATILGRELLVTGIRGIVEATGTKFGADWFGKLKTILQCIVLFAIFLDQTLPNESLQWVVTILLYAALAATIGSGVQYIVKAARIFKAIH